MNAETLCGKVLGTCTLQALIGRGSMGAVFLAQQSRPRRQVAVKVLLPMTPLPPDQHAAFLVRFQRETDAAASLAHPNIIPVHEYGESDGLAYLVMPYVSGGTLREELARSCTLPLTVVVDYLEQIADALAFAHERGIIHRDIKPANIMLTPDKRLLLTDFGLAKIISDEPISQIPISDVGIPMGSPHYMAPEQVVGADIDARADIYSLGVLTYHMITGSVPFQDELPMKVALQHMHNDPPPLRPLRPDLPAEAEQVVLRAMAKRPADRYASARDFASAFRQALEDAGVVLDAQVTATLPLQKGERAAPGRRRSLFDPFWRNALRTPAVDEQSPVQASAPAAQAHQPAGVAAANSQRDMNDDIVAKNSMMLPSPSGLAPTNQPVPATETRRPVKATVTRITPLPATEDMENSPFYPKPAQQPMPSPAQPGADNAPPGTFGQNSQFLPPRKRPGGKTNLLGNPQYNQGQPGNPQGSQQPGQMGDPQGSPPSLFQKGLLGTYDMAPSAAANPSFWSQAGTPNDPATQGGNGTSTFGSFQQPGPAATPGNTVQPGMSMNGTANNPDFGQQPGMTNVFNRFGQQAGTGALPAPGGTGALTFGGRPTGALPNVNMPPGATGALQMIPGNENTGQTGMLKLTQPVKVVKVPLAGQPGQYVTGLLPVLPGNEGTGNTPPDDPGQRQKKRIQMIALIGAALLIIFGSLAFVLSRAGTPTASPTTQNKGKPNTTATSMARAQATQQAQATATALANTILIDPLQSNIHNWYVGKRNNQEYSFKDGAYHIKIDENNVGLAILPDPTPPDKFSYTLTMQQVDGVDNDDFNRFGLIIRYNFDQGNKHATFYSFELANNTGGGKYYFQKFDSGASPQYSEIWHKDTGNECHLGKGQTNTIKIVADKDHFTFFVNNQQVGDATDGSFGNGQIGMFVNMKGTEVAFHDLSLMRN